MDDLRPGLKKSTRQRGNSELVDALDLPLSMYWNKNIMAPKLPTRQLGKDGPQVTALGYGMMGLSAYYAPAAPDEERLQFLDYVYNSGIVNWDTSDVYGDSENPPWKMARHNRETG